MKTIILSILIIISFYGHAQCDRQLLYDDYSDSTLWTTVGLPGVVSFSGGTLNYNTLHGGDYGRAFRPLPSALPDNYWNATCSFMPTEGNGPAHYIMAFTSGTLDPISYDVLLSYALTDEDAIMVYMADSNPPSSETCCMDPSLGTWQVVVRSKKGTVLASPSAAILIESLNQHYYVRLQRLSTSYVSLNIYSDSTMLNDLPGSPVYYCIDPTITALTTVHQGVVTWSGDYRILSAKLDNLAICLDAPAGILAMKDSVIAPTCATPGSAFVTVTGGTTPYTITWNTSPVQYGDTAVNLPPGTYTVIVADASADCLPGRLIDTIVVPSPAGAFLSLPTIHPGCPGLNNGSISITNSGGDGFFTYVWSTSAFDTSAIYNLSPGFYSVTVTDSTGCNIVFDSLKVAPPVIGYSFSYPPIKCFNDTTALTIVPERGTPPYSMAWTTPSSTGPTLYGVNAGIFAGLITDDNGCTVPFNYTLNQPPLFTATTTSSFDCSTVNSGNIVVNPSGGNLPYSYFWSGSTDTTYTRTSLAPGNYTVVVTDSNQCSRTLIGNIPIYAPLAITAIPAGTCAGRNDGSITATITGGLAGYPYEYSWAGFPADSTNALTTVGAGTYTIKVTSGSCTDTTEFSVPLLPAITTTFSAAICSGETYTLPSGEIVHNSGSYADTLSSSGGCDSIFITELSVDIPFIGITSDLTIISGSSTLLVASGELSYEWSPSIGLSCTLCASPTASPEETTKYCVTGSNGICTDSACVTVTVEAPCPELNDVQVPDAFSPNNDGNNDLFLLQGWNNCLTEFTISIYDRWGEKVYESADVNFSWDGMYKGKILDPAVFVYYMHAKLANGRSMAKKGNITLIK